MILAKPVVPDQFWILKEDDRKIGNIQADSQGYSVCINNSVTRFKTLTNLQQRVPIDFEIIQRRAEPKPDNTVNGYPTTSFPYNAIFDVKHQLPLWTRDERSKSWYAAGWYLVRQHRSWKVENCPKLIMLERYEYRGPFYTKSEAESAR